MSIDNIVEKISVLDDGKVRLHLIDGPSGPAGPKGLVVINPPAPPETLRFLEGARIWGAGEGDVYFKDTAIGKRVGYTRLEWYHLAG